VAVAVGTGRDVGGTVVGAGGGFVEVGSTVVVEQEARKIARNA